MTPEQKLVLVDLHNLVMENLIEGRKGGEDADCYFQKAEHFEIELLAAINQIEVKGEE